MPTTGLPTFTAGIIRSTTAVPVRVRVTFVVR